MGNALVLSIPVALDYGYWEDGFEQMVELAGNGNVRFRNKEAGGVGPRLQYAPVNQLEGEAFRRCETRI